MGLETTGSSRRRVLATAGGALATAVAGCLGDSGIDEWEDDRSIEVASAVQYHDPSCGCCGEYATYLEANLAGDLEIVEVDGMTEIKREYDVPSDLASCHTVDLDGQVVEGHVPAAAIEDLLAEPDLAGIALPGMPDNSPGMGAPTDDPLEIYGLLGDGAYEPFRSY